MVSYLVFLEVLTFSNHPVLFIWNKYKILQKFKTQLYFSAYFSLLRSWTFRCPLPNFAYKCFNLLRQYRYQTDERALFVIFLFFFGLI